MNFIIIKDKVDSTILNLYSKKISDNVLFLIKNFCSEKIDNILLKKNILK